MGICDIVFSRDNSVAITVRRSTDRLWETTPTEPTFTFVAGLALTVAGGTFTLVRSHGVDAVPSGTETRHGLALVHV